MLNEIAKDIALTVKESVQSGIKALSEKFEPRLKAIEERFDALPVPKDGQDGKSVTIDEVTPVISEFLEKAVQNLKAPDVDYDIVKTFISEEVAKIPTPENGESVTVEDVTPLIKELIADIKIPVPEKGEKGDSVAIEDVRPIVQEAVIEATKDLKAPEIDYEIVKSFITDEFSKVPVPKDGENGKSVTVEDVAPLIKELVDAIELPVPQKGEDGKSVTLEEVQPLVLEAVKDAVAQIPVPKDGEPGKDAEPVDVAALEKRIDETVSEKAKEAQNALLLEAKPLIDEALKSAIAQIPVPKDGEPGKDAVVDMTAVQKMIDEAVEKAVSKIHVPEPKNGEDGKDALDIEILPEIDETKSYSRNSYAIHAGGLWRSYERTNGMRGWETVVDGIADIKIDYDGVRGVKIVTEKSSGEIVSKEFAIPAMIYKGVWKEGRYSVGDTTTMAGSLWTCLEDTDSRPGDGSKAWQLSAKKGRDANSPVKVK